MTIPATVHWPLRDPTGHDKATKRDAGSRFNLTIDGATTDYLLRSGFTLSPTEGTLRTFIDKAITSSAACPDRPFTAFGTWSLTLQ